MITISLKNGEKVDIPNGMVGSYENTTKTRYVDDIIETNLVIKDSTGYESKILATFKSEEVIGFIIDCLNVGDDDGEEE